MAPKFAAGVNYRGKSPSGNQHHRQSSSSMLPRIFQPRETNPAIVSEILQTQVTRIFLPQTSLKTAALRTPIRPERRRTPRRHIPVPLFVYGHAPEGQPFYEVAFTSAVNVHG